MKKNKSGFMSISLIFSFFVVFIALILALLANYAHNRVLVQTVNKDVKNALEKSYCSKHANELRCKILDSGGGGNAILAKATPNFNQVATTNAGIFAMPDDFGLSYYYRGAVNNNYLTFAGFCWRIIRINGDGSVRLIYNGTTCMATGSDTQINSTTYTYNSLQTSNAYVGYMYGAGNSSSYLAEHLNSNNSNAKSQLDTWYNSNIVSKGANITNKIVNSIFCNDRSISSEANSWTSVAVPNDTAKGFGTNSTNYGYTQRIGANASPSFKCNDLDKNGFTLSTSNIGNKKLTLPVGLITADEVNAAGGVFNVANSSYYLNTGQSYWTMTPLYFTNVAQVAFVNNFGSFTSENLTTARGIRPVISLIASIEISGGTGFSNNPYVIS